LKLSVESFSTDSEDLRGLRLITASIGDGLHYHLLLNVGDSCSDLQLDESLCIRFDLSAAYRIRQIIHRDESSLGYYDVALQGILQLPTVARPVIASHSRQCFLCNSGDGFA